MEGEPGRELPPAPPPEIVLAHGEHPRAELRPPDMGVEKTAPGRETLPVEHQRRQDEHQVIGRDREVVDHAERRHGNLADGGGQARRRRSGKAAGSPGGARSRTFRAYRPSPP